MVHMLKYGKLQILANTDLPNGSSKKVEWLCDCGRTTSASMYNVTHGITKSCGKCNLVPKDKIAEMKFGKLRMMHPLDTLPGSGKKTDWMCDCGRTTSAIIGNVFKGKIKSCGKCGLIPSDQIAGMKFGKLRMKHPIDTMPGSNEKTDWVCDCGRTTSVSVFSVFSGNTKTCNKCSAISKTEIASMKFGKLRIKIPEDVMPGSGKKIAWMCDCGKELITSIHSVVNLLAKSCGKCNLIPKNQVARMKFGKLRMKHPIDTMPGSGKKTDWMCDCGEMVSIKVISVFSGKVKSCGKCCDAIQNWYLQHKDEIRSMKCPVEPSQFVPGGVKPLETVQKVMDPFRAECPSCKTEYAPRLDSIKRGASLTCGCSTSRVSFAVKEITAFIESLGVHAKNEHTIGKLKYDIFIESHNLAIEYNGLRWHSMDESKQKDLQKYNNAASHNISLIMIFEDEWVHNKHKIEAIVSSRLGCLKQSKIRASSYCVEEVSTQEANRLYADFHYIGECNPKKSYGMRVGDDLVACISFGRPTRQSKHEWELLRMVSHPKFRVYGAWQKILAKFIDENRPKSIVTFSDNRLFSGGVYAKLGFELDGSVRPDYYWTKGQKRFHKSAMRKKLSEKNAGTETFLRGIQGYSKVWDYGKKRWVWSTAHAI